MPREELIYQQLIDIKSAVNDIKLQHKEDNALLTAKVEHNAEDITDIKDIITRYRGFAGGVLFVFSIIWGAAIFLKSWILGVFT